MNALRVDPSEAAESGKKQRQDELAASLSRHLLTRLGTNPSMYVQTATGGPEPTHHNAILVGNLGEKQLFLRILDGMAFDAGQAVIVHVALTPHLVEFKSEVLSRIMEPPLHVIRFPEQLQVVDVRKMKRLKTYFPAELRAWERASEMAAVNARVVDISAGGCSFRSKAPLRPAEPVQVSFSLPGDDRTRSLKAMVIESSNVGAVYHNRAKFEREPDQEPVLLAVEQWVLEGLTYTPELA